jgi:acyl-CoA reductase-like NAD-dependent aldehyde dehydrogenase
MGHMSDVRPVRIGDDRYTGSDSTPVHSPYDGRELARVPVCTAADVDRAVAAARRALDNQPLPPWKRAEILDAAARGLEARIEELARTIAGEAAKPLKAARVEAARAVSTFTFAAVEARKLAGEMVPIEAADVGEGKLAFTLCLPIGVVGAISPFNFPLNLVAHKVAPAIAAGCPVVLKPAGNTPLSAIALADILLDECGLPAGYLNVVTGSGREVGNAIVEHGGIALISFTGSSEVGWGIAAKAPRKKVKLELGNSTPVIVEADADWEKAADKISVAGFSHAGQSCISTQRVYVQADVADDFCAQLAKRVGALQVGDPMDDGTDVSSLISADDRDRVKAWIDEAVAAGAELLVGGEIDHGVLQPTVLRNVTPDMKVSAKEVFGPVVGVQSYTDLDDALDLANSTEYGLQAGIFTARIDAALRAARTLAFGGITVNEVPTWRADQMPYGGVKESGNTKEGPAYAVQEMTERRLVVLQP